MRHRKVLSTQVVCVLDKMSVFEAASLAVSIAVSMQRAFGKNHANA